MYTVIEYLRGLDVRSIRYIMSMKLDDKSIINLKNNDYVILFYTEKNSSSININDEELYINLNEFYLFPKMLINEHSIKNIGDDIHAILFEINEQISLNKYIKVSDKVGAINNSIRNISIEVNQSLGYYADIINGYVSIIISMFKRLYKEKSDEMNYSLVDACVRYIENNYSENITIEKLAEIGHSSKSYLMKQFCKVKGVSPIKYVNKVRINIAKKLLGEEGLSVKEIAIRVGFVDQLYFSRVFKQNENVSPTVYRNKIQKNT